VAIKLANYFIGAGIVYGPPGLFQQKSLRA